MHFIDSLKFPYKKLSRGVAVQNRIYDDKIELDTKKIKYFYEKRPVYNPIASAMLRTNPSDGIANKRNENEIKLINRLMDLSSKKSILDIGCGPGRWAANLENNIDFYDGIDFCENYINYAKHVFKEKDNIRFFQMSVDQLDKSILDKKYDLILINGLCMYINDIMLERLFRDLNDFIKNGTRIYLRESVSIIGKRLTLKDFPSEELETEYNAIYRTPEEYEEFIRSHIDFVDITSTDFLLDRETGARGETNQKYWFLS